MSKLYLRSFAVLITLVCYYFGLTLIQIPQDPRWISIVLVFGGYIALGFIFGFLFNKRILTSVALVFTLGFFGAMLSIISYGILLDRNFLPQTGQDLTSSLFASFFISIAVAAGTFVSTLLAWIAHRLSSKGKDQRKHQLNEDRPQAAEVI